MRGRFTLGVMDSGRLYEFGDLGRFKSHAAAIEHFDSRPRNARERTVTIETRPCMSNGIEYGIRLTVRTLDGTVIRKDGCGRN
jgi:hypothetical protein